MKLWKKLILSTLLYTNIVFGEMRIIDKIVALINHDIILDSDVKYQMNMLQYNLYDINQYLTQNISSYQQALNQLITENLVFQAATQENNSVKYDKINKIIEHIAHLNNMTLEQFHIYLRNIGINYEKYSLQLYQEILKTIMYNHIVHQRAYLYILPNEINKIAQELTNINFNKQFKLTHIIFSSPIQATLNQINKTEYLTQSLIKKRKFNDDIIKLIDTYSKNNIFQTIKIQENEWIACKDIPIIFNQYLQKMEKGNIIGPIYSYDGIHILEIEDIRDKTFTFPITRVKIKKFSLKDPYETEDTITQLLKIKEHLENNENKSIKTLNKDNKSRNISYKKYEEYLEWKDLEDFTLKTQKILLSLKKNEISTPVYTDLKWCLIQLQDVAILNYTTMIRERAYLYLLNQKFKEIINNWILELRSESYIKIID